MSRDNDLVGEGLPKPSHGKNTLFNEGHVSNIISMTSVQQGKQKVTQKGEASTAEPSADMSDSRDTISKGASHVGRKTNNIQRAQLTVSRTTEETIDETLRPRHEC